MSALHKSENDSDSMKEGSLDIRNLSPDSAGYGAVSNHEKRPGSASDGGVPLSGQKQPYRGLELSGRPGFLLWKVFRLPGTKNSRLPVLRILAPAFLLPYIFSFSTNHNRHFTSDFQFLVENLCMVPLDLQFPV